MKGTVPKLLIIVLLAGATCLATGGSFYGWFLPKKLDKPVSLRDGSEGTRGRGLGLYFLGRSHYGGGYRGGK